jgi:hypothetical protein
VAVKEWKLVGIVGGDGRTGLLEADDVKTEMMKMRKIVVLPGVRIDMRLELVC